MDSRSGFISESYVTVEKCFTFTFNSLIKFLKTGNSPVMESASDYNREWFAHCLETCFKRDRDVPIAVTDIYLLGKHVNPETKVIDEESDWEEVWEVILSFPYRLTKEEKAIAREHFFIHFRYPDIYTRETEVVWRTSYVYKKGSKNHELLEKAKQNYYLDHNFIKFLREEGIYEYH